MSTEEVVEDGHDQGPPWNIVGRFPTFDEADQRRLELTIEENLQVKVRWMRTDLRGDFVVKTRLDPALAETEALKAKREEKKRRKAKLNKRRRKK
jgi:hypothetical protein